MNPYNPTFLGDTTMTHHSHLHPTSTKLLIVLLVLWACFASPGLCETEEETRTAAALGAVPVDKDAAAARLAAVNQALLKTVEKSILDMVPVDRLTEKLPVIEALLPARRDEFIKDYKVLKESSEGGVYRVLVQATVLTARIQKEMGLQAAAQGQPLPKVLLLVAERSADDVDFAYWWNPAAPGRSLSGAVAIGEVLAGEGFTVMDETGVTSGLTADLQPPAELPEALAIEIGKRAGADVVVTGTGIASETPNRIGESMLTFKGEVVVRPIIVATGEVLAPAAGSKTAIHPDRQAGCRQALNAAGKQAGTLVARRVLDKWRARSAPVGGDVFIRLSGADIVPHLPEFRKVLKGMTGVKNPQTIEIAPSQATVKAAYAGTPQAFADALVLQGFSGFGVNIVEVVDNQIQVEVVGQ